MLASPHMCCFRLVIINTLLKSIQIYNILFLSRRKKVITYRLADRLPSARRWGLQSTFFPCGSRCWPRMIIKLSELLVTLFKSSTAWWDCSLSAAKRFVLGAKKVESSQRNVPPYDGTLEKFPNSLNIQRIMIKMEENPSSDETPRQDTSNGFGDRKCLVCELLSGEAPKMPHYE